jgi:hypothetical protein
MAESDQARLETLDVLVDLELAARSDAILAKLPKSFTSAHLAKATPTLKGNSLARNIALARWSRAGSIEKSDDGKDQVRAGQAAPASLTSVKRSPHPYRLSGKAL